MLFFLISSIYARYFSVFPSDVNNPLSFNYGEGIYIDNIKGRFGFVHVNGDRYMIMVNGITLCPNYKKSIGICRGHEINNSWRIVRNKTCLRISAILEHDGKINEYCWTFSKGNRRAFLKACSGGRDQIFKLAGFDYTITTSKNLNLDEQESKTPPYLVRSLGYPVVGINPESLRPSLVDEDGISETANTSNEGTRMLCTGNRCARYRFRDLDSLGFKGNTPATDRMNYSLEVKRINNGTDNMLIYRRNSTLRESKRKEGPPKVMYKPYSTNHSQYSTNHSQYSTNHSQYSVGNISLNTRRITQTKGRSSQTTSQNYQLMKPSIGSGDEAYGFRDSEKDFLNIFGSSGMNPYLQHYENTPYDSISSPTYQMRSFSRITTFV